MTTREMGGPGPMSVRLLERVRVFTGLGIRFWDSALDVPVTDGLVVHAWLSGAALPAVRAQRTASGVYAFHELPGRAAADLPPEDETAPEDAGPPAEYVIVVEDRAGRFLPAVFGVAMPLGYRGEFLAAAPGSPPGPAGRAYLFSSPARPQPPGTAALRADFWDADADAPAAHVAARATVAGREAVGIADEHGRMLLLCPHPAAERLRAGSPPGAGQGAPGSYVWPVSLRAAYRPASVRYPLATRTDLDPRWAVWPALKSVLEAQPAALLVAREGEAPVDTLDAELRHGEELLLRTAPAGAGRATSRLWVTAGASPP